MARGTLDLRALLFCACLVGCNRYVAVEPIELARIAAPPPLPRAETVRTLDGNEVKVKGDFDVVVHTTRGDYSFERPVVAWLEPGALMIARVPEAPVAIPLGEIYDAELKQVSGGRTVALIVPLAVVGVFVAVFLTVPGIGH